MDTDKIKKLIPYFIVFVSFTGIVILMIILIDWFILPAMIHSGDTVKVPMVIGKPMPEAEKILSSVGLSIAKVNEQYSENTAQGLVINQVPKPGQSVKSARSVYLTVSKGQESVSVPYIVGQPSRSARIILKNKGLDIGNIEYISSDVYGPDSVVVQKIAAGKSVAFGSRIDLIISKGGTSQVKVPQLDGMKYDDAVKTLQECGLVAGSINYVKNETYLPNTILNHNPAAGELVSKGATINLTITK